ncbi:hypothetical protein ACFSTA_05195 [Ornithinibacillus salinisoli]|uniref:Uncharacterized protein n=1 Tax=Ornithinibacillus salinisoli TaxID=1848459 RepID=A0ABW4W124_9BACI
MRPIISFLIALHSTRLLSYFISSLVFIVIFFAVVLLIGEIQLLTFQLFKFALQSLAVFGGTLLIIHVFKQFTNKRA